MYVLKCENVSSQAPMYDSVGNGDGDNFRNACQQLWSNYHFESSTM